MLKPPLHEQSNEELLSDYQQGSYESFEVFYRRNSRIVYHFLLKIIGNRVEAEDALQTTFLKVHRYIMRYDPERKALLWVFGIAKNTAIDIKSGRREHIEFDDESTGERQNHFDLIELEDRLAKLLKRLPDSDQEIIKLRYLNEASYREISEKLSISEPNARQKIGRILKKLRQI